jgi:glucose-6-phosphate dehydrogenase assembly protein OpcA
MAEPALLETWDGEDVRLAEVEATLARLREASASEGEAPNLRTSVMTHVAWVPDEWAEAARATLAGMQEEHPSRTILLIPDPDSRHNRIDANVSVECYRLPGAERHVCSEVVELQLHGPRAKAPASIVSPLLIADLPVFCRWRGEPPWNAPELEQLVDLADRFIVDSTEWDDLPFAYSRLVGLFARTAVSDIAWARTARWRALLASLWPDIADVSAIRVTGTAAQGYLLAGWLRSRLGREIDLEHVEAERLIAVDLDGQAAPFPPGDPPLPSNVLSEELDRFTREPVYEAAVAAAASA